MIARSKERKLEKARGKEEQESERERLDEGMTELMTMLSQRPTKGDRRIGSESDDYDQTMRVRESYFRFSWAVMGTSYLTPSVHFSRILNHFSSRHVRNSSTKLGPRRPIVSRHHRNLPGALDTTE